MSRGFAGTRPQGRSPEGGRKPLDMSEDRPSPKGRGSGPERSGVPDPLPAGEAGVKAPQRGAEGQRPLGGFSRSKHDLRGPAERLSDLAQPGPFYRCRRGGVETIGFLRVSFDDCSVWRELRSV